MSNHYDYIICGAGAAGLSLAVRLANSEKSVLIIDPDPKDKNDRTFSFWKNKPSFFDNIIAKTWPKLIFNSDKTHIDLEMGSYTYNMIRGIDFYKHCKNIIEKSSNILLKREKIEQISESDEVVTVQTDQASYNCEYAFKSFIKKDIDFSKSQFVIQHFLGYEVECASGTFEEDTAIFMDFSIDQDNETRFMYVLPSNDREALIELAIFSNDIPDETFYKKIIDDYIKNNLGINSFKIKAIEIGQIPMTNYSFKTKSKSKIVPIGTAAGAVKPSSGFAFHRIQEHLDELLKCLQNNIHPNKASKVFRPRFKLYDSVFLNAILTGKTTGKEAFTEMFKKSPAHLMFKFLDEKTHFHEEFKVFLGPPMWPFTKAFFEEL